MSEDKLKKLEDSMNLKMYDDISSNSLSKTISEVLGPSDESKYPSSIRYNYRSVETDAETILNTKDSIKSRIKVILDILNVKQKEKFDLDNQIKFLQDELIELNKEYFDKV